MSSSPAVAPVTKSEVEGLEKLTKDLKKAAATLSRGEARFLVDTFYSMQKQRIVAGNQVKALQKTAEPHDVLQWFNRNADFLETQVQGVLSKYAQSFVLGKWALQQYGIGPVITAGLLAHIDIEKAPTVGHIWSFAGLNPTAVWGKGQKRPWNAELKVLCWKIGESLVNQKRFAADPAGLYVRTVFERKDFEHAKNTAKEYATQAGTIAAARPGHAQVATYQAGMLPDGHIYSRAKRYAVKLFLAHYHAVAYELRYGTQPPKPYILTKDEGHVHLISPPLWPMDAKLISGLQLLP